MAEQLTHVTVDHADFVLRGCKSLPAHKTKENDAKRRAAIVLSQTGGTCKRVLGPRQQAGMCEQGRGTFWSDGDKKCSWPSLPAHRSAIIALVEGCLRSG